MLLPYEEGEPGPPGYYLKLRARRGLIISGSVTLGSAWLLTSIAGAFLVENDGAGQNFAPLFVPVVGPFIALGTGDPNGFAASVLIMDGLTQTAGLTMLIAAFLEPERVWKRKLALEVTPIQVGDATGIGLRGTW